MKVRRHPFFFASALIASALSFTWNPGGPSPAFAQVPARENLDSMLQRGSALEAQGEWTRAAEVYSAAASRFSTQTAPFERLGAMYLKNAQWQLAADNYQKALDIHPGNESLARGLAAAKKATREQAAGVTASTFRDMEAAVKASRAELAPAEEASRGVVPPPVAAAEPARIPVQIGFARNKYAVGDMDVNSRRQLDQVATLLMGDDWRTRRPLVVEGHTCSCGTDAANLALGQKRAQAVIDYLVAKKVLQPGEATARSMGSASPILTPSQLNLSAEACARDDAHNGNRRVIIREAGGSSLPVVTFWHKPFGSRDFQPLEDGTVLFRNDELNVKVQAPTPLFAYVLHQGPDKDWEVLYPRKGARENAVLPEAARGPGYWIPGRDTGFPVGGKAGQEEALVYLSTTPIPELETPNTVVPPPPITGQAPVLVNSGKGQGPEPPPKPAPATAPVRIDLGSQVRGLPVPQALKVAGLPRSAQPVARVRFASRD